MPSLSSKVIKGSYLLVSVKMLERAIGLISTLILARLLMPADFGIIAIAMLVIYFFEALTLIGGDQYIIQKTNITCDDLNTVWTLNIIFRVILWVFLIFSVKPIAIYYELPELESILYAISLILIIGALKNPGFVLFKKKLDYSQEFKLNLIKKITSFITVIVIAYTFHTYWAVIIGSIVSFLVLTIGSYLLHPFRPKLCLQNVKKQWAFSQWLFYKGILGYVRAQADTAIVSSLFPADQLGKYHITRDLSVMPSIDIILPALTPLLAAFSKIKNNTKELVEKFELAFYILNLIIIPLCFFIYFESYSIIHFLLGEKWLDANPILRNFSILLYGIAIIQLFSQLFIATGKVKQIFIFDLVSSTLIILLMLALPYQNIADFALNRGLLGIALILILFTYLKSLWVDLKIIKLLFSLLTPLFAAYLSSISSHVVDLESVFLNLLIKTIVFFLIYCFSLITLISINIAKDKKNIFITKLIRQIYNENHKL